MADRQPGSSDGHWAVFEAEAMPHVDGLFRLAMWWERDRREAEELVQDALVQALLSFHRCTAGTTP
jgi:DNA-directed RNA polymerase specialized sigma24 family protein